MTPDPTPTPDLAATLRRLLEARDATLAAHMADEGDDAKYQTHMRARLDLIDWWRRSERAVLAALSASPPAAAAEPAVPAAEPTGGTGADHAGVLEWLADKDAATPAQGIVLAALVAGAAALRRESAGAQKAWASAVGDAVVAAHVEAELAAAGRAGAAAIRRGEDAQREVERLKAAVVAQNHEVCQSLGKALGFPRYCDDPSNFPGTTEADGVCVWEYTAESIADRASAELAMYKTMYRHAIKHVDRVFQLGGQPEPPLLPDFLLAGDDKFKGVVTLAEAYIAQGAALAEWRRRAESAERERHALQVAAAACDDPRDTFTTPSLPAGYVLVPKVRLDQLLAHEMLAGPAAGAPRDGERREEVRGG